jgi:hypothetical protein
VTNDGTYYVVAFINPEGKRVGCMRKIGLPKCRVQGVNADMSDDELAVRGAIGFAQMDPWETGAYDAEEKQQPHILEWRKVSQAIYGGCVFTLNPAVDENDPGELDYAVDLECIEG